MKAKEQIDVLVNKAVESGNKQVLAAIGRIQDFHAQLANAIHNYLLAVDDVARFGRKVLETKDVYETLLLENVCTVIQKCDDIIEKIPRPKLVQKTCQETKKQVDRVCGLVSIGFVPHCTVFKLIGIKTKECKNVEKFENRCSDQVKDVTRTWDCSFVQEVFDKVTRPDLTCEAANESCRVSLQILRAKQTLASNAYNEALRIHAATIEAVTREEQLVQASLKPFYDAAVVLQDIERQVRLATQSFISNQVELTRSSLLDLRGHVEAWRDQSRDATNEWIAANAQAMLNSASEDKDNVDVAEPLMNWLVCRLPTVILPIPAGAADSICEPIRVIKNIHGRIAAIENNIIQSLADSGFPFVSEVATAFLQFKESAPFIASSGIQKIVEDNVPVDGLPNINLLHHAFKSKHSDAKMNQQFASDNTVKHLITFPNEKLKGTIIDHMRVDMGLIGSDNHEPLLVQKFNPTRNALQLMKLSLLAGSDLNAFTRSMGFLTPLFDDNISSILSPWLRSIDGNHQWLPIAPPFLRKEALADEFWQDSFCKTPPLDVRRRFQMSVMPLYSNPDAKRLIFDRMFRGPLSVSLEANAGGFADLRPEGYMYRPTFDNAFPNIDTMGANIVCPSNFASPPPDPSIIYSSETYALGTGGAWDPNNSTLFNTNLEPYVGFMHQRAMLKSRNYWGAASYKFDTDWGVDFDFSVARTLSFASASWSGPLKLMVQLYGEHQETAKLAVDIDSVYTVYQFEIADFRVLSDVFNFSRVKGLIFAIAEENFDAVVDIDTIQVLR